MMRLKEGFEWGYSIGLITKNDKPILTSGDYNHLVDLIQELFDTETVNFSTSEIEDPRYRQPKHLSLIHI